MDSDKARSLLVEIFRQLPPEQWWLLRERKDDDYGIPKAFGISRLDVDSLLVNAAICKETGNGFSLIKKQFEIFKASLPHPIEVGTKSSAIYITNGVHPVYDTPSKQSRANVRFQKRAKLPSDILNLIDKSSRHYVRKNDEAVQIEKSQKEQAERVLAAERAKEAAKKANAIMYPLLSEVVEDDEMISLNSEKIRKWVDSAISEVVHLHKDNSAEITMQNANGTQSYLLQIPRSSDSQQFMVNDCKHSWIERSIMMGIGEGMTLSQGIECVRRRLDALEQKIVSDSESSSNSDEDDTSSRPKKRQRNDIRMQAAKVLAPRFDTSADSNKKLWDSNEKKMARSILYDDAKDFQVMTRAISRANPLRAADVISMFLSDPANLRIKNLVHQELFSESKNFNRTIVAGIRESISHHTRTRGSRNIASEMFVKNVALASVFGIEKKDLDISDAKLGELLGLSRRQIKHARNRATDLILKNTCVTALERETRKDFIRDKLKPHVYDYLKDDSTSRLDTNAGLADVRDPRTGEMEKVHKRIWNNVNKEQQHLLFLNSDYYTNFQRENPGATVGYKVWAAVLKSVNNFVTDPRPQCCVDERIVGLEHMMAALLGEVKWKKVKEYLEGYSDFNDSIRYRELVEVLRKAGAFQFVDAVCCAKEQQYELRISTEQAAPLFVPLPCTHGKNGNEEDRCVKCGVGPKLGILSALAKSEFKDDIVEVMIWRDSPRQGMKNGKQNAQRELHPEDLTLDDLVTRFLKLVEVCIPHFQEIRWMKHLQDTDFDRLPPGWMLIYTDYSATMNLCANQKKNSSVDAHAVNANFICIYNRRMVKVKEKEKVDGVEVEVEREVQVFDVDIHHFLAETLTKGKKADHQMHIASLDALINEYSHNNKMMEPLAHIIVWTDNAPTQYRCRQTFIRIASIMERYPHVNITHRLAVPDNFKGPHDGFGKITANKIRELEGRGTRSGTAFKVFENLRQEIRLSSSDSKWKKYEKNGDARLRNKGKFGMDSRELWFVAETEEERSQHAPKYGDRIVLCDRSFVLDTNKKKAIEGTIDLHEVRSTATEVQVEHPIVWPATVSNLPCNCQHCVVNPDNNLCFYAPWRKTRAVEMEVGCMKTEEAETFIGTRVCRSVKKEMVFGTASKYLPESRKWEIENDKGGCAKLDYVDFFKARDLYGSVTNLLQQQQSI